jgi:EmrB/QacA subfamily drug resistance transporter
MGSKCNGLSFESDFQFAMPSTLAKEPTMQRKWLTLAAVAFAVFVTTLDNTIVNVALPSIQRDLHLGLSGLAWVVDAYILSFAVLLLTGGRLADSFGRRRLFLAGLSVFTLASLFAGLAPSASALIAARAIQGVGAALMTPSTLAIISHTFTDPRERASAVGIWAATGAGAFAIGPVVGGLLTEHLHWTWVFFVNVPVGVTGLLVGSRVIPESTDPNAAGGVDVPGVALGTAALFALTFALIKANDYGWGSTAIVTLLAGSALGFAAFVAVERRAAAPMIDLSLFRNRAFTTANVVTMVANLATFGVLLYTSLYLQNVVGESPVAAGAALLPWVLMIILLAPLGGRLGELVPANVLIGAGMALVGLALLLFAQLGEHSTFLDRAPALIVGGIGGALTFGVSNVAISAVPVEMAGVASGIHNAFRETGGSFGIAIIGAVFAGAQSHALATGASPARAFVSGYSSGLTVGALIVFAAAALALAALRGERSRGFEPALGTA